MKKTIYKKDTKNKIRFLELKVEYDSFIQTSGVVGTENPVVHKKTCKPKNVGKSNETSGHEQAVKEFASKLKEKLSRGYFETIEEAEEEDYTSPMLAYSYDDYADSIDWDNDDVYIQPKLDGMRCLKSQQTLKSRNNIELKNMAHIASELNHIKDILDGELYAHEEDFQTNMDYIKDYTPGLTERIKYHVYDMVLENLPFKERYILLKSIIESANKFGDPVNNIVLVPTFKISSVKEMNEYYAKFMEEGYEGAMIRVSKSGYKKNARTKELLKYKKFQDIAIPVKDIVPCKTMEDWGEVLFDWPGAKGHRCGINILGSNNRFDHKKRKEILINKSKYIGLTAEVRFFEYSNTGVPRFPVVVGFRIDK